MRAPCLGVSGLLQVPPGGPEHPGESPSLPTSREVQALNLDRQESYLSNQGSLNPDVSPQA